MTILPEPACFTSQEYKQFLREYPHAEKILASSYRTEEGENIPLVRKEEENVFVYVGLLSEEEKLALGNAALRELHKHLTRSAKKWGPILSSLGIVSIIVVLGILWKIGMLESVSRYFSMNPKPTPVPTAVVVPTAAPTSTPAPTSIPRPQPTAFPTIVPTMTPIPSPTATPITEVDIEKVVLQDAHNAFIPAIDGMHALKPGERVTLDVQLNVSSLNNINVEYSAVFGKIEANSVYIAPVRPGGKDLITVKVIHKETGKLLAQRVIKIKIIATQ